ncbi:Uma2 family endonuclease [Pseudanabaena yagii]|uniref:Uma2 family endonuclease n=1 Tax=Pseudanabaena yagii GIHE-NHR1 TaxID=2722753 RepID=A0ABX1LML6_9CYAN|nr:Uma2 family endonuclease [Pseudanabaena yagii]NMF57348.1 Uma2 family endonuclease [Pseudanabaena yagii GIHE-NHR1]
MFRLKYPAEQSDPPLSPRETLPTMYDLPSEDPEESGLPDQFHDFQPELLGLTFRPANYPEDIVFTASDLNLYYDVHHQNWHKRPDWFAVLGVPRLYDGHDLRLSYVIWQEGVSPSIVVELLSPSTEKEDLGELEISDRNGANSQVEKPPSKWKVYEQILRIPYYLVFSRYTNQLRVFTLRSGHYVEMPLTESKIWIPEIELGLGIWEGEYRGIDRLWLRWYDSEGNWIPTDAESLEIAKQEIASVEQRAESAEQRAESAEQRAESAEQRAEYLLQRLRELGIEP